jgi:glyoxylase I family protein
VSEDVAERRRRYAEMRAVIAAEHLAPHESRPATSARGVHHVALICADVRATVDFYQGLLEFPLTEMFENRDYPGSTHFFFDIGNDNMLAFFDFPGLGLEPAVEAIGSLQHLAISMAPEEYEKVRSRLDEHGVEYLGPDRGLEESIYLRDPDGIQIELTSVPLQNFEFS